MNESLTSLIQVCELSIAAIKAQAGLLEDHLDELKELLEQEMAAKEAAAAAPEEEPIDIPMDVDILPVEDLPEPVVVEEPKSAPVPGEAIDEGERSDSARLSAPGGAGILPDGKMREQGAAGVYEGAEPPVFSNAPWRKDMPGLPVKNIRSGISLLDRALFINRLFGEDFSLYDKTIGELNAMESLDAAVAYLQEHFPAWDFSSEEVYRFMMSLRKKLG